MQWTARSNIASPFLLLLACLRVPASSDWVIPPVITTPLADWRISTFYNRQVGTNSNPIKLGIPNTWPSKLKRATFTDSLSLYLELTTQAFVLSTSTEVQRTSISYYPEQHCFVACSGTCRTNPAGKQAAQSISQECYPGHLRSWPKLLWTVTVAL